MQVGVLHMRKAGGTSVVENVRRACEKIHVQEWGMFHIHSDKYNILTLRNPVRRAVSSYLFEGGAPQCWEKRIHRPEQLVACLQRYNALLPFHLYRTISMRLWKQHGSALTFQSEYNGARVGVEGKIGRPYIPNYFMHKLTGDGNFTRALARVDAVDMIVIPGRVPIRWSSRPVPPCLDSVSWNVSWSAEGYVHELRSTMSCKGRNDERLNPWILLGTPPCWKRKTVQMWLFSRMYCRRRIGEATPLTPA